MIIHNLALWIPAHFAYNPVSFSHILDEEEEVENVDVSSLPEEVLRNIEADSYWCMSKLLDGIQVNWFPLFSCFAYNWFILWIWATAGAPSRRKV